MATRNKIDRLEGRLLFCTDHNGLPAAPIVVDAIMMRTPFGEGLCSS